MELPSLVAEVKEGLAELTHPTASHALPRSWAGVTCPCLSTGRLDLEPPGSVMALAERGVAGVLCGLFWPLLGRLGSLVHPVKAQARVGARATVRRGTRLARQWQCGPEDPLRGPNSRAA